MSISVVIPCFNAEATIGQAIASVLEQSGREIEILVVDDGSTDHSLAVARSFGPRVRVITGPNRGVAAARNRGIAKTGGEWIVFLDADDLLLPKTLARRSATAAARSGDVVICDWQDLVEAGRLLVEGPTRSVDPEALAANPEVACAAHLWAASAALMYRRNLVDKIGGFRLDLPVIQDARFLFDAARHGARFVRSPHVGALYRIRPQSLSRRDPACFWRDVLLNGMQIEALWRARGCLAAGQRAALADIYNGAAQGLFRARDPSFHNAFAALRASGLPIRRHNRVAELMSDMGGQLAAVRLAELWTMSRQMLQRAGRTGTSRRPGRAG
jgi:glycosyltransferase involved in cell wall biosynthesis